MDDWEMDVPKIELDEARPDGGGAGGGDAGAIVLVGLFIAAVKLMEQIPELIRLIKEIAAELKADNMPNIPAPTLGGKVVWTTLKDINGVRLQQNTITKHYRIIAPPPKNTRLAWGTQEGMEKILRELQKRTSGGSGIN